MEPDSGKEIIDVGNQTDLIDGYRSRAEFATIGLDSEQGLAGGAAVRALRTGAGGVPVPAQPRLRRDQGLRFEAEFQNLPVQRPAADFEDAGRLFLVPTRLFECAQDRADLVIEAATEDETVKRKIWLQRYRPKS